VVDSVRLSSSISAEVWADNADLARAALDHAFVRRLADGTLQRELFQGYVLQDAYFLEAFARAYALALARSPDRDGVRDFYDLLSGALQELQLHARYAAEWEVSADSSELTAATLAYTDFLMSTAALGNIGEVCAAMTPCMRLYAFLGQSLEALGAASDANPYSEWVKTYAAPEFEALAAKLEMLLDRYTVDAERARRVYRRAMMLEVAFFDAALRTDA